MKKIKRIATMAIIFVYIFCISTSFVGCNEIYYDTIIKNLKKEEKLHINRYTEEQFIKRFTRKEK